MPKYMFFYRGGHEKIKHASPDQMQQVLQMWMDWIEDGIKAGWMLDRGNGLKPGGSIVNRDLSVIDAPFDDTKQLVDGYSMVEASNLNGAVELAKSSPMPKSGGTVEIRELSTFGKPDE